MTGIKVLGILGATTLGALLGRWSRHWILPAVIFLSPPGWYTIQASVDAMGAASVLAAYRLGRTRKDRYWAIAPVSAVHLVAGLGLLFVTTLDGGWRRRLLATLLAGIFACSLMAHVQVRYFLPALTTTVL